VAGIVDIDILKEGGVVWSDFLDSGSIPKIEKDSLASMRGALKDKLDGTGKNMKSMKKQTVWYSFAVSIL
jgi:hypothetical protein